MSKQLVGVVLGVVITIVGGLAVNYLQNSITPAAKVSWHKFMYFNLSENYFAETTELTELLAMAENSRQTILVVDNAGDAAAKGLALVLPREPFGVAMQPALFHTANVRADGRYAIEFDPLMAGEQVRIAISGLAPHETIHVQLDGLGVRESHIGRLVPYERGIFVSVDGLFFIALVLIFIVGSIAIFKVPTDRSNRASRDVQDDTEAGQ